MAEQKQSTPGALPKNIRQIGTSIGSTRVYLEDYVYTYLHTKKEQEEWTCRGFVLLGRLERNKESARYFISGLIRMKDHFFQDGILEFSDETWAYIYQEMKQYYDNLEIVGWGQDVSNASASLTAEIERNHKQNFNIQKNVLFLLDLTENEEAFYIFEKNMLQRREGYYVYYEKNPQMQEYMIETQKGQELNVSLDEVQEPLVHTYREALLDKKAQMANRKWNGILYTTSMLLVLSVCVLGVSTVNNVEKMQNLETTVNQISSQVGQAGLAGGASPAMSTGVRQTDSEGTGTQEVDDSKGKENRDTTADQAAGQTQQEEQDDNGVEDQKTEADQAGKAAQGSETDQAGGKEDGKQEEDGQTSSDSVETDALSEAQTYLLQGYYIVKKGDSLVGISKKIYGTPKKAEKICELNGIEDMDKIYAGQKLELP